MVKRRQEVLLGTYTRFLVGKGDRIMFWKDLWLRERPLKEVFPKIFSDFEVQERVSTRLL